MIAKNECSKCGGAMQEGFIIDRGHVHIRTQKIWIEGAPKSSLWQKLKHLAEQLLTFGHDAATNAIF